MEESLDFMNLLCLQVQRPDNYKAYVINIDKTAVYSSMHLYKILEVRGMRTVHIKSLKDKKKWCTVALTIMAS